jgi:acetolactate synthase-1/3 small subunit
MQVPVWAVLDYTDTRCISRELVLVKVSILGPDYIEEQLLGGPTHDPRHIHKTAQQQEDGGDHASQTYQQEVMIAEHFEHSGEPITNPSGSSPAATSPPPLTPSEVLRLKHQHLHSISVLATQFGAKIVDVSDNSVIVEMSGKTNRVEAFLSLVKPFGIIESARTGMSFTDFCRTFVLWRIVQLISHLHVNRHNGHATYTACFAGY